jgi:uncharacterized membrane protein YidH (DUF202 family)
VADRPDASKPLPSLVEELWQMVVAYAKQETVEPLKGLPRFVAFGVGGALLIGLGVVLLLLGLLRVLQVETDTTFTGNWSWVPYGITLVVALLVTVAAGLAITRKRS